MTSIRKAAKLAKNGIKEEPRNSGNDSTDESDSQSIGGEFISRQASPVYSDAETHNKHSKHQKKSKKSKKQKKIHRARSSSSSSEDAANQSQRLPKEKQSNKNILNQGRFKNEKTLRMYLSTKRPTLEIAKGSSAVMPSDDLDENEEIWFVQCPKSLPVEQLVGQTLKLNGKPNVLKAGTDNESILEYEAEKLKNPKYSTIINKSSDGWSPNYAFSFLPAGLIRVLDQQPIILFNEIEIPKQTTVPYPSNLKVRHPILGYNYANCTELNETVQKKLNQAVRKSNIAKSERFVKREKITKIEDRRLSEIMDEDENPNEQSPKKIKRRLSSESELATPSKKRKKVKRDDNDEKETSNLDWLSNI